MEESRGPGRDGFTVSRSYRSLWSATATIVLASGVLTALLTVPLTALVGLFVAVAVMVGGSAWAWANVNLAPTAWAVRLLIWSGTWAVAAVGLTELLGGWGLAGLGLLGVTAPRVIAWGRRRMTPGWTPTEHRCSSGSPQTALVAQDLRFDDPRAVRLLDPACTSRAVPSVVELTANDLGRLWKISGRWLHRGLGDSDMMHLVTLRAACLDELERRDPEGLRRWLAAAHASTTEPTRFLAADPQPPDAA
jgi:hypothetical protein